MPSKLLRAAGTKASNSALTRSLFYRESRTPGKPAVEGTIEMLRNWLIFLGLLYFLVPYDLIPDFLPVMGRIDDLLLLGYLYWTYVRKRPRYSTGGPGGPSRDNGGSGRGAYTSSSTHGSRPSPSAKDPYHILEVNRSASNDEIKRAYRLQASRYHPDKVAHLGEEFQSLAKEKFQDIQWAYEKLMKERERS
jgi:DnaJ like chaperone protein